jgi:hypothetical protein
LTPLLPRLECLLLPRRYSPAPWAASSARLCAPALSNPCETPYDGASSRGFSLVVGEH